MSRTRSQLLGVGLSLAVACGAKPAPQVSPEGGTPAAALTESALQKRLAAMTPAAAKPPSDAQQRMGTAIEDHLRRSGSRRFHVHLDKPLYQPGETIWFRIWELTAASLTAPPSSHGIRAELVSPKGATVIDKRILADAGVATNDFELPADVPGGEYILRVTSDLGGSAERKLIVSQYQPPRIKKKAEFLRKAYGPGDTVAAALSLLRATGEPLSNARVTALVTVDDAEVARLPVSTDAAGNAVVRFPLPGSIARGDGLLTILVDDGGVTESMQKRIPIVMKQLRLELYPEGGQLVSGLPGRVYFMARNLIDKPADVEGRVIDGSGATVARFASLHQGLGRFEITPRAGQKYTAVIDRPANIATRVAVPAAIDKGCSLQAVDDFGSKRADVRVAVWCSARRDVIATAMLRDRKLGDATFEVPGGEPAVIALPVPPGAQGAVRITLFDDAMQPLAERLIYRNRGADLKVAITADKPRYSPRDPVALTVQTRDLAGNPVEADLSLAVVDDTVLAFADDKSAHLLARLYLESEMPGQEVEEPNFYFSADAKAPAALDLVLGTQGWRRFDWAPVFAPPVPATTVSATGAEWEGGMVPLEAPVDMAPAAEPAPPPMAPPGKMAPRPMRAPARPMPMGGAAMANKDKREIAADMPRGPMPAQDRARIGGRARDEAKGDADFEDVDWGGADGNGRRIAGWAPVRVFPAPTYDRGYDGPRVDFRETIHWQPSVKTGADGKAMVRFHVSDAITGFRAIAEGASRGGLPGRGEAVIKSTLPISLAVQMPLEVSAGDRIELPVVLENQTEETREVGIATTFGAAFRVDGDIPGRLTLKGGERRAFHPVLRVVGDGKDGKAGAVAVAIDTGNLRDAVERTVRVVPLGFPREVSAAGTLARTARHEIDLSGALPGTLQGSLTLYPSPLATVVQGTEAIIREPYGCFEQASSANYPNIMVLSYLEENQAADPALVERTMGMLDRGYKMLAGYESPQKGYEWFGGDPGHEALTAYGLMEFRDMTAVYGDVDRGMVDRTRAWLRSRRDGKGGFQRNPRALDSFGSASPEVTNGYIAWALSEAGEKDMAAELAVQKQTAADSKDPYLVALAAGTIANLEPQSADRERALARLAGMQGADGGFPGADHSITRSGGDALAIETTALAVLALLDGGPRHAATVRKAIEWLNDHRSGYGSFSSTQATVLALKAMSAYAASSRATPSGGRITVLVNGDVAGQLDFEKGHRDPLAFTDLGGKLKAGKNVIELRMDAQTELPYSLAVEYRSKLPASSPEAKTSVTTALAREQLPVGEGVKLKVGVRNLTREGIPMTLARVGLPGGLTFQTWQLKELRDKKLIDFYETREREVILYFRSLPPGAVKNVDLDLLAQVPGDYVGPASRAYLYYTDEHEHWAAPLRVKITR